MGGSNSKLNCFAKEVKWSDERLNPKVTKSRKGKNTKKIYKPPKNNCS